MFKLKKKVIKVPIIKNGAKGISVSIPIFSIFLLEEPREKNNQRPKRLWRHRDVFVHADDSTTAPTLDYTKKTGYEIMKCHFSPPHRTLVLGSSSTAYCNRTI